MQELVPPYEELTVFLCGLQDAFIIHTPDARGTPIQNSASWIYVPRGPVPRILRNSRGARPVNSILTFHPFFRPDSFVVSRHARFNRSRSRFSSCNDSSNPLNFFLSLPRSFWPRSFPRDFESISSYSLKENQLSIELENSLRNVISMKRIFGTIWSRKNVSNSIFNPIRTSVSVF